MSTNATTWFYAEPETGRPYMIGERLIQTFWANRLMDLYLECVQAEPPYQAVGQWRDQSMEMEWEVKQYFRLRTSRENRELMAVCSEILGFRPTVSYSDSDGHYVTEWYLGKDEARARIQEIQGNPVYTNVQKKYN